jgi:prepilin-type N-terminal cleavage/methylation domain-containing protein
MRVVQATPTGSRIALTSGVHRGFTVIELVVVMMILSIVACIALPKMASATARYRAEAAAKRVAVDLTLAQRHAKVAGVNQKVTFDPVLESYVLGDLPAPVHPELEYQVFLADEPYDAAVASADFGGDAEIIFDIYGRPDSGGSVVVQVGNHLRTISVDPDTGEASVQ